MSQHPVPALTPPVGIFGTFRALAARAVPGRPRGQNWTIGLEIRRTGNRTVGSNPTLSASNISDFDALSTSHLIVSRETPRPHPDPTSHKKAPPSAARRGRESQQRPIADAPRAGPTAAMCRIQCWSVIEPDVGVQVTIGGRGGGFPVEYGVK